MEKRWVRSACPYDCPDTCGLLVETDGARVFRVKGDPDHPVTQGFLCRKMQRYDLSVNHPGRILHPMKRTGPKGSGSFARITWDQAVREIADRWNRIIAEHGPEAVLPYFYSGVMSAIGRNCGTAFFNRMGASNLVRTICASGKSAGWHSLMGDMPDMDPREFVHSDLVVIWGSDVAATRLHLLPLFKSMRKQGKKIVLVETYKGPTADICDETILVRPASDGALALAMMHVLAREGLTDRDFLAANAVGWDALEPALDTFAPEAMERVTGVRPDVVRNLARAYGKAAAPAILIGSGLSRHRNGALNTRCVAMLPAVVGAWGKPGGGAAGNGPVSPAPVAMDAIQRPDFRKKPARSVNMNRLAAALGDASLSPPLKSLYVFGANPAAVTGNQKALLEHFAREDLFMVVHERFLTDTARFADIVLPATFSVETGDIHTCYGYRTLQVSRPAAPPPGECKSNWDAFRALAAAMGYDDPHFRRGEAEMLAHVLEESKEMLADISQKDRDDLAAGLGINLPRRDPLRFATASGKIELCTPAVAPPVPEDFIVRDDGYPLRLVAAPSPYTLNSTFTEREDLLALRGPLSLLLNADDARARGIADGDAVVCRNELAEVRYLAKVTDAVPSGTVIAPGVHSPALAPNGLATNALMRERLSDMGEATTLNDNGVEVKRA